MKTEMAAKWCRNDARNWFKQNENWIQSGRNDSMKDNNKNMAKTELVKIFRVTIPVSAMRYLWKGCVILWMRCAKRVTKNQDKQKHSTVEVKLLMWKLLIWIIELYWSCYPLLDWERCCQRNKQSEVTSLKQRKKKKRRKRKEKRGNIGRTIIHRVITALGSCLFECNIEYLVSVSVAYLVLSGNHIHLSTWLLLLHS
jgi:hypothetical protein